MYHWLQLMKDLSFFLKKYNKVFIEGNKNCKFFTISSIKYKFRKWAKRLIKEWAKRLRVGGRNDSLNGGRNDSGAKRLRANGKVGETTRYRVIYTYRRAAVLYKLRVNQTGDKPLDLIGHLFSKRTHTGDYYYMG